MSLGRGGCCAAAAAGSIPSSSSPPSIVVFTRTSIGAPSPRPQVWPRPRPLLLAPRPRRPLLLPRPSPPPSSCTTSSPAPRQPPAHPPQRARRPARAAAAAALAERGLCLPVLLGSRPAIRSLATELAATLLQREKQEGKRAGDGGRTPSGGGGRKKGSGPWSTPSPCPAGAAGIDDVEALPADRRFLRGLSKCEIIDPFRDEEVGELTRKYADGLARARAHRGMTLARARELLLPGGEGEAAAGGRVPGPRFTSRR